MKWLSLDIGQDKSIEKQANEVCELYSVLYSQLHNEKKLALKKLLAFSVGSIDTYENDDDDESKQEDAASEDEAIRWAKQNKIKVLKILRSAMQERIQDMRSYLEKHQRLSSKRKSIEGMLQRMKNILDENVIEDIERMSELIKNIRKQVQTRIRQGLLHAPMTASSPRRQRSVSASRSPSSVASVSTNIATTSTAKSPRSPRSTISSNTVTSYAKPKSPAPSVPRAGSVSDSVQRTMAPGFASPKRKSPNSQRDILFSNREGRWASAPRSPSQLSWSYPGQHDATQTTIQGHTKTPTYNAEPASATLTRPLSAVSDRASVSGDSHFRSRPSVSPRTAQYQQRQKQERQQITLVRSEDVRKGVLKVKPIYAWEKQQQSHARPASARASGPASDSGMEFRIKMSFEDFKKLQEKRASTPSSSSFSAPGSRASSPLSTTRSVSPGVFLRKGEGMLSSLAPKPANRKNNESLFITTVAAGPYVAPKRTTRTDSPKESWLAQRDFFRHSHSDSMLIARENDVERGRTPLYLNASEPYSPTIRKITRDSASPQRQVSPQPFRPQSRSTGSSSIDKLHGFGSYY